MLKPAVLRDEYPAMQSNGPLPQVTGTYTAVADIPDVCDPHKAFKLDTSSSRISVPLSISGCALFFSILP